MQPWSCRFDSRRRVTEQLRLQLVMTAATIAWAQVDVQVALSTVEVNADGRTQALLVLRDLKKARYEH